MKLYTYILIILGFAFISCGSDEAESAEAYIQEAGLSGFDFVQDHLYVKIDTKGNDNTPKIGVPCTIHYSGTLTDGTKFDSSYDRGEPFRTDLSNVISGWRLALPLFGEGGKGTLVIGPELAYGNNDRGSIPAGSVLIFDIEVLDVE